MTATDAYVWPSHWDGHGQPHDWLDCRRCIREADWRESHEGCPCVDHGWDRVDVGTAAVPELVWCCLNCCRVQGPAFDGGADGGGWRGLEDAPIGQERL